MTEWQWVEYQSLASKDRSAFAMGPFGSKITKENYVSSGVPVVRGVNLARGIFSDEEFVYITSGKADELMSANVQPGDLIFTHRGTIGQVSMIPRRPKFNRYVIGSSQVKTRLDESQAVPEFYYYWFQSLEGQRSILANASTVGVPGIATPLTSIRSLNVPRPSMAEQRSIVATLAALDDKISINRRIATTARQLAINMHHRETSVDGRVMDIGEVAAYLNRGQAPRYTTQGHGMLVVNQKCVRDGRVIIDPARHTESARVDPERQLLKNDVLVNSTGVGTLGRVGIWSRETMATVDSHVTIIRINQQVVPSIVGAFAILAEQSQIEGMGEGSTGQTELNRTKLGSVKIKLPTGSCEKLASELDVLEQRAAAALSESQILANLRDTLLPELMSGRLHAKRAEQVVEDAV
ncbi:restriction endonuclease subunit S [Dactylosporangium sp. NPDC049140]|uniref:restriction endonuclease subunit S n=1 Tax=Dactylosporangium sp. NPDC049140 TaxID=3155647 RepID=UPI0034089299